MNVSIWIVQGRCGEYSDAQEWPVAWCETEEEANRLRDLCAAEDAAVPRESRYEWDGARHARQSDPYWRTDYTGTEYSVYPLKRWP